MTNSNTLAQALFQPTLIILAVALAIAFFILLIKLIIKKLKRDKRIKIGQDWRTEQELLQNLRSLTPSEFEKFIADLFTQLGFKSEAVGKSNDGGIDVIAVKDNVTSYIQCKKFISREVTVGAIRDFYGALANKLANGKGYFITTNKFTLEAQKFAEDKPIELIDGFRLIDYIKLTNKDIITTVVSNDTENMTCPECGNKLIKKRGKFGYFIGCSNYPNCRFTRKI